MFYGRNERRNITLPSAPVCPLPPGGSSNEISHFIGDIRWVNEYNTTLEWYRYFLVRCTDTCYLEICYLEKNGINQLSPCNKRIKINSVSDIEKILEKKIL